MPSLRNLRWCLGALNISGVILASAGDLRSPPKVAPKKVKAVVPARPTGELPEVAVDPGLAKKTQPAGTKPQMSRGIPTGEGTITRVYQTDDAGKITYAGDRGAKTRLSQEDEALIKTVVKEHEAKKR